MFFTKPYKSVVLFIVFILMTIGSLKIKGEEIYNLIVLEEAVYSPNSPLKLTWADYFLLKVENCFKNESYTIQVSPVGLDYNSPKFTSNEFSTEDGQLFLKIPKALRMDGLRILIEVTSAKDNKCTTFSIVPTEIAALIKSKDFTFKAEILDFQEQKFYLLGRGFNADETVTLEYGSTGKEPLAVSTIILKDGNLKAIFQKPYQEIDHPSLTVRRKNGSYTTLMLPYFPSKVIGKDSH